MPTFGQQSLKRLTTCHPDIIVILNECIKYYDFSVIYGIRTLEEQQKMFAEGHSTLDGINQKSRHQGEMLNGELVSMAVDVVPYKKGIDPFEDNEKNRARFYVMMGMIKAIAARLLSEGKITHRVRFGMDWDGDDMYNDQTFDDLPHLELV